MQPLQQPVENSVIEIIEDLTQDWGLEDVGKIDGATCLVAQLDFASVDIIQLCVALEQHHGRKLGFQELLMANGKYVDDLSIRQVAEFVTMKLASAQGAAQ